MGNYPKVSIIILNWNGVNDTIECLESLQKIDYPNYEVIVVDNASSGNDVEILKEKFGDYIHIIRNDKNYGFAEGNNIAIRWALKHSVPDYFLLLNNDTVVDPAFLTEMVKLAESDPTIGIAGPKVYEYYHPEVIQFTTAKVNLFFGRVFHTGAGQKDKSQFNNIKCSDYAPGSSLLFKKQILDKIGFLDTAFFCYWEETDFCQRALKAGYRIIYCPSAIVWHKGSAVTKKISGFSEYYLTRNKFLFVKKNGNKIQKGLFPFFFLVHPKEFFGHIIWYTLVKSDFKLLASYLKAVIDGLQFYVGKHS